MGERCVQLPRLLKAGAEENTMSQHPSYKSSSASAVKRNVLKRFERVELLKLASGQMATALLPEKDEARIAPDQELHNANLIGWLFYCSHREISIKTITG